MHVSINASCFWQHGDPRLNRNNRELQPPPDRWAASDRHRNFTGRMVNNRPGPWKRPAIHQRHHHSPPPHHHLAPRNECPAKRKRDSGPDQVITFSQLVKKKKHIKLSVCFSEAAPPLGETQSCIGDIFLLLQPFHPGSRHLPPPAHAPSSPNHSRCYQEDKAGPCYHSEYRTSTTQQQVCLHNQLRLKKSTLFQW